MTGQAHINSQDEKITFSLTLIAYSDAHPDSIQYPQCLKQAWASVEQTLFRASLTVLAPIEN